MLWNCSNHISFYCAGSSEFQNFRAHTNIILKWKASSRINSIDECKEKDIYLLLMSVLWNEKHRFKNLSRNVQLENCREIEREREWSLSWEFLLNSNKKWIENWKLLFVLNLGDKKYFDFLLSSIQTVGTIQ